MHTGAETAKWDAHDEGATDLCFHPSGAIATAGRDGRVKVWEVPSAKPEGFAEGKLTAELGWADDGVLKVAFTADAKTVVSGAWSGAVRVWPVAGGTSAKLALPIEAKPVAVAVVPVPTPDLPVAAVRPVPPVALPTTLAALQSELDRKRAALKAVEEATEKLKNEAAPRRTRHWPKRTCNCARRGSR